MRIVTRPDLDGIACATLLIEAEGIDTPVLWVSPNDMQRGKIPIQSGDIIAKWGAFFQGRSSSLFPIGAVKQEHTTGFRTA